MRGVLLTVTYDGEHFHGWAAQPGMRTVQGVLLHALTQLDPQVTSLRGTSRTDRGVHARGQKAAFDTTTEIPTRGWVLGVNQHLPDDVAIASASRIAPGYNPRFDAQKKRYEYRILRRTLRDPLRHKHTWRVAEPLALGTMESEARSLLGTHDFAAFSAARDARENTVRTLTQIALTPEGDELVVRVEGNAFLYNMVRILVGTLVDVGRGKLPQGTFERALLSKDRRDLGITAPAHGLTLDEITLSSAGLEPFPEML